MLRCLHNTRYSVSACDPVSFVLPGRRCEPSPPLISTSSSIFNEQTYPWVTREPWLKVWIARYAGRLRRCRAFAMSRFFPSSDSIAEKSERQRGKPRTHAFAWKHPCFDKYICCEDSNRTCLAACNWLATDYRYQATNHRSGVKLTYHTDTQRQRCPQSTLHIALVLTHCCNLMDYISRKMYKAIVTL